MIPIKNKKKNLKVTVEEMRNFSFNYIEKYAPSKQQLRTYLLKKYIKSNEKIYFHENSLVAIITPDKDIIPNSNNLNPAFLVSSNYEQILKWNRSLRFALAVCTLKDKIKDEI